MKTYAPLIAVNPQELNVDWQVLMREVPALAEWITRTFSVDVSKIIDQNELIISTEKPTGEDANKPWLKTGSPVGIGIPYNDDYVVIYQYPPFVPFIWTQGDDTLPTTMRKMTTSELEELGLTAPSEDSGSYYVMFEPEIL